ncbi:MAG: carboxypeptidase regulatory-like domain-containing protein [Bryobacteraceae bacterium]
MRRTLAGSLLALLCSAAIYAQAVPGAGSVTGIVRDQYGDGIPEVTLVITNPSLGVTRTIMTSDEGLFNAPGLVPSSTYALKATKKGYEDWTLANFDVSVGESVNFRIPLVKAGSPPAGEPLSALAPVQDTKMSLSALVTFPQLQGLPSNARLVDKLVLLAPAVSENPSTGYLGFRGEQFMNSFLLDGINDTNSYSVKPGISPLVAQDAIAEMQVISAAAPADFGHASGGIVNAVTRSGTDDFHVEAYDYYILHSMVAPDPFGNNFKPTGDRQQAGLSLGAPIAPDRFFVFGNFEMVNWNSQALNRITNPLITDPTGNSIPAANCTATAAQCTAAINFIKSQMNVVVPRSLKSTSGFVKFDFRPSDKNNFTMEGDIVHKHAPNGMETGQVAPNGGLLGSNATYTSSDLFGKIGWTTVINENTTNEFHGSYFKDGLDAYTDFSLAPSTGPVGINLAGTLIGSNPLYPANLTQERIAGVDIYTQVIGAHTIKIGADVTEIQDRVDQLDSRYGSYDYASLTAFAQDFSANVKQQKNYALFTQTLGTPVSTVRTMVIQAFAHDTWKATPRLIVDGGIRWEKTRIPNPTEPNPDNYQSGFIPSPNVDFSPRIGAAYMLDNRTVVRLGLGTYFEPFPGQLIRDLTVGGGVYQTNYTLIPTQTNSPVFPKPLAATSSVSTSLQNSIVTASKFRNPYTEQGTVAIERRLNKFMALAVSFIDTLGQKLWTADDLNISGAKVTAETYTINNASGAAAGTYATNVFSTNGARNWQIGNEGASRYMAGVAQLRTALSHGLSLQTSYTYSHASDDIGGPPVVSIAPSNINPLDYRGDQGPSALDQRHRLTLNWTWQPRVTKGNSIPERFFLNGWQLSGIATGASSLHETALVDVMGQQFTGVTMAFPTLSGFGGWSRVPFEAVNTLPIGNQYNVDARLTRELPFTSRLKAFLMIEAYNALNHKNYTSVEPIAFTAVSGVLKPVTGVGTPTADYGYPYGTSARRIQVALKLVF